MAIQQQVYERIDLARSLPHISAQAHDSHIWAITSYMGILVFDLTGLSRSLSCARVRAHHEIPIITRLRLEYPIILRSICIYCACVCYWNVFLRSLECVLLLDCNWSILLSSVSSAYIVRISYYVHIHIYLTCMHSTRTRTQKYTNLRPRISDCPAYPNAQNPHSHTLQGSDAAFERQPNPMSNSTALIESGSAFGGQQLQLQADEEAGGFGRQPMWQWADVAGGVVPG